MIKAILTDIEGTTTSISFVHDVLFPYAREHIADYVRKHANEISVREQLNAVCEEAGETLTDDQIIAQLVQWIDEDRKVTPLKALQGMLWEAGYKNGDFKGHVYPDAYSKLCEWSEKGLQLYVYSSGSVKAQKLLYSHTEYGDLTRLFHGYFDTNVGGKKESTSYEKIAEDVNILPGEILFLSDIKEELDAAFMAGMKTIWLVREGELETNSAHTQVVNFNEISF